MNRPLRGTLAAPARSPGRRGATMLRPAAGLLPLAVALAAALAAALGARTELGERLELRTHDLRFAARGARPPARTRIVLALLDEETQRRWQDLPAVFWGGRFGAAITQANRAGAAWVALDVVPVVNVDAYLEALGATQGPWPDAALEQAITGAGGNVILTYTVRPPMLPNERFLSLDELQGRLGFADVPVAADGVIRQAWPRHPDAPEAVGLAALLASCLRPGGDPAGAPAAAAVWIDATGAAFPSVPLYRLAAGELSDGERAALRGAVVLIGASDVASRDLHDLPGFRRDAPGVEMHANALATLAEDRGLRRWAPWQESVLAAALALAMTPAAVSLAFWRGLLATLIASAAYLWLSQAAFAGGQRLFLPAVGPLAALLLPWLLWRVAKSLTEATARRRVERVFGRYLSPVVRDHLLHDAANQRLGGTAAEATLLFYDIRGWTTYAQARPAAEVLSELNALFAEVVPVIERHGGLINRFLGDGFLAVFGVPMSLPNPAAAALAAAREAVAVTERQNGERAARGLPPWRAGCGLHTGEVMAGSVGARDRAEFTVIGDAVNLASRLEGLNKELAGVIVLSGETRARLGPDHPAPPCGPAEVEVRGRPGPVTVYWYGAAAGEDCPPPNAAETVKREEVGAG